MTSLLAVWATCHDFKNGGKINREGIIAIFLLGAICVFTIVIEAMAQAKASEQSKLASEQLKKEDEQREILKTNLGIVESRVNSSIKYLNTLEKNILSNYSAIQLAEENLTSVSKLQLLQQKQLGKRIKKLSDVAKLELSRLSSPIKNIYLSSSFKFVKADKLFKEYYDFLKPVFYEGEGNYGYSKRIIPEGFDLSKLHYFLPDRMVIGFYKNIDESSISISKIRESQPELELTIDDSEERGPFDQTYSNLDDGSIIKSVSLLPLLVKKSNGNITSTLDFTDLVDKGDYITLSFTSTYPENVIINQLSIHTNKSQEMGVKLTDCKLLERESHITYILSESFEINNFRHIYACKLWAAKKLLL